MGNRFATPRKRLLVGLAAIAIVASGCQWASYGFDSGNSRFDSSQTTITPQNAASLTTMWTGATGGSGGTSSPVMGNGFIYLGSSTGQLLAFDQNGQNGCTPGSPTACQPVWTSASLGSPITSTPTVSGSDVYVTAGDQLFVLDGTGTAASCSGTPTVCQPLWSTAAGPNTNMSTPQVTNGVVYVHDSGGLYAFDAAGSQNCSGTPLVCSPLWKANGVGTTSTLPPAVVNGTLYTVGGGHLYAFDAAGKTGCAGTPVVCQPLWSGSSAGDNSGVLVSGGTVYTASDALYAYDAAGKTGCSGTPVVCTALWKGTIGGNHAFSPMALANGSLFVVGSGALDVFSATGTTGCSGTPKVCSPMWTGAIGGTQSTSAQGSAPAVGGSVVYVGGTDGKLYAFDSAGSVNCSGSPGTCTPLVTKSTTGAIVSSPTPTNAAVYVGSNDGNLYAFGDPADYLNVTGSPLSGITASSPSALSPAFSQSTHDYAVNCAAGANTVSLTLTAASGSITLNGSSGSSLSPSVNLVVPNQAVVVQAPDPTNPGQQTTYWIRCLPPDFPKISMSQTGTVTNPGYYLYGNLNNGTAGTSGTYAMVLNGNGTPVWYQKESGGPTDVEELGHDLLTFAVGLNPTSPAGAGYTVFNLDTQSATTIAAANPPTDSHELLATGGNYWLISDPTITGVNLSSLGGTSSQSALDCVVQEVSSTGSLLWSWDAQTHVGTNETSPSLFQFVTVNGQQEGDPFHCNSVDVSSDGSQVLISMRNTAAVYDVDKATGSILWKLGGTTTTHDNEKVLTITNDSETTISGQHDARFEPNGNVSLYDDHTALTGTSRGVQYAINTTAGTATLDFQYLDPNGATAFATGGFRRYSDGDSVISWGFKTGSGFSEIDSNGNQLLRASFPGGEDGYRAIKVPLSSLDASVLRNTAGWPAPK